LKFNTIDGYLQLLKNLNLESRMKLIKKLSDSLNDSKKRKGKSTKSYNAFISKKTAAEIITDIKNSRNFNRSIERL